jgi:hypothetical protein
VLAGDRGQQPPVPAGQARVQRFVRPPGQEDRRPDPAALELTFVPQRRAGQRRHGDGRGPFGIRWHAAGDARLVVVFQEAHQPLLIVQVGAQMVSAAR